MDRAEKEGVALHPHPSDPYVEKSCQILLDAFERADGELSSSIRLGVVSKSPRIVVDRKLSATAQGSQYGKNLLFPRKVA
jgi:hypothetical protein